jgi:hypothetical protein
VRWTLAGVFWLCCVTGGFFYVERYKSAAAATDTAPARWPRESTISLGKKPTLVMFVHPHCACSRASMAEMSRLLARIGARVSVRIVFVRPRGAPAGFENSSLREAALALPNVVVLDDDQSVEAERFGATASGTCVLYAPSGQLLFHGGITPLRGHEGNSFGQERIVALLTTGSADRNDSPVFGCDLEEKTARRPLEKETLDGSRPGP